MAIVLFLAAVAIPAKASTFYGTGGNCTLIKTSTGAQWKVHPYTSMTYEFGGIIEVVYKGTYLPLVYPILEVGENGSTISGTISFPKRNGGKIILTGEAVATNFKVFSGFIINDGAVSIGF